MSSLHPSASKLSRAEDHRKRRIIAEDQGWTLEVLPRLSSLCVQSIMTNSEGRYVQAKSMFDQVPPSVYERGRLSPSLPLQATAHLNSQDPFWERCCRERWQNCDMTDYDHSWKRMFFERHLEEIIEHFIPEVTEPKTVLEVVPLCRNVVKRLNISQLLPPIKEALNTNEDTDSESDSELVDHFDFRILLDKLTNLEELRLMFRVKRCGMNYERGMFMATRRDCESLGNALMSCKTIKVFKLSRSQVDDDNCQLLVNSLLDHPSLMELDLSHNLIGDRGARAVCELLNRGNLVTLNLYNNNIGGPGAQDLAQALTQNSTLLSLNLCLNHLGDEGSQAFVQALLENSSLLHLHLGNNELTEISATALCQVLLHNKSLRSINLSGNQLSVGGGKALAEAMSQNSSITHCDIRLSAVDEENKSSTERAARNNKWNARKSYDQRMQFQLLPAGASVELRHGHYPARRHHHRSIFRYITRQPAGLGASNAGMSKTSHPAAAAAEDHRRRRIIAEDPHWNLELIPRLSCLCVRDIMTKSDGRYVYANSVFEKIPRSQRAYELVRLSPSLPLQATADLNSQDPFWERCCRERWQNCDLSDYDHSWKRMFFERHLEEIIEHFIPEVTEPKTVLEVVPLCRNVVKRLNISQLLPPIKEALNTNEDTDSESDSELVDHFDFRILLDKLTNLEELRLMFRVKRCGMNYERGMFMATRRDCESLGNALTSCKTLKVFKLSRSQVDDDNCQLLVNSLLDHPSLMELDLSHNLIGDRGARAVCELLNRGNLVTLNLYNNNIGGPGALDLAQALTQNSTLLSLNLCLNRLGDEGSQAFVQALLENSSLLHLHLGNNELTEISATALCQVLLHNKRLRSINMSGNQLSVSGGKALAEAMSQNSSITHCDVRLSGVKDRSKTSIERAARNNKWNARKQETDQQLTQKTHNPL
ncbi:uncharacterized protein drc5 [Genypterus blacodes]|uniref:uncharacterized protein drc5 n=1 Tax=Genypterus blacodes TaxID=154954 RepID=UPI003F7666FC